MTWRISNGKNYDKHRERNYLDGNAQADVDTQLFEVIKACEAGLGDVDKLQLTNLDCAITFLKMSIGRYDLIEDMEGN